MQRKNVMETQAVLWFRTIAMVVIFISVNLRRILFLVVVVLLFTSKMISKVSLFDTTKTKLQKVTMIMNYKLPLPLLFTFRCLGGCKCGNCGYEDSMCGWILDGYCKHSNGAMDPDYKANECKNCPQFKKICGLSCNFCPA